MRGKALSPLVDIGVTTYKPSSKRLGFLRVAIESILAQTFADWHVLVSENGADPGDGVARILEPFLGDPRVEHVRTEADLSGAANSTRAMSHGAAPFVTLLHDDDLWEPQFLERRIAFLQAHAACGFVFGGNTVVDEDGRATGRSKPALSEGLHSPEEYVPLLLEGEGVPMPPTALIRRSAFEAIGGAFDERVPAWDYDLYLRLGAKSQVGYLNVWDSAYRVHSHQLTYVVRWGERHLVHEDAIDEMLRREVPHLRLSRAKRRRRRAIAFMAAALDAVEGGERRRALTLAARGVRTHPRTLVDPRLFVVLALAAAGPRLRPLLTRARTAVRQHRYLREGKRGSDAR